MVVDKIRLVVTLLVVLSASPLMAAERYITLASTTSTENSGLFRHLLPIFTKQTGITVRVVAVGTGQALRLADRGDADVLLVHHKPSELALVSQGVASARHDVMYNDFVVIGPLADPAAIRGLNMADAALLRIATGRHGFVSRGDDSGTHKVELALWTGTGVDLEQASGNWYRETGSGMGATLNVAAAMSAYTLSDRATWVSFRNKRKLAILVEGDPAMFNQYGVLRMNPARYPHLKHAAAARFVTWLLTGAGQKVIASFRVEDQQLFVPNSSRLGP